MESAPLSLQWPLRESEALFAGGVDLYTRAGPIDLLRLVPSPSPRATVHAQLKRPPAAASPWLDLRDAEFGNDPFPHVVAPEAIRGELADKLASVLASDLRWTENDGGFYSALECDLRAVGSNSAAAVLFAPAALSSLEVQASAIFNTPLRLVGAIAGHRLDVGRGIGLHTDRPSEDAETHRILFTICDPLSPDAGGHFLLADGPRGEDVRGIIPLRHNTAIAFALTAFSHHGVTIMRAGVRFSVVFSFARAPELAAT